MGVMDRVKELFGGRWMMPAGPEPFCGDACVEAATRFGYEERRRLAERALDEQAMADSGEWTGTREAELRLGWETLYPQWPWDDARPHVWRAWAVAGSGDTAERALH